MKYLSNFKLIWTLVIGAFAILVISSCTSSNTIDTEDIQPTSQTSKHLTIEEAKEVAKIFLNENDNAASMLRAMGDESLTFVFQEPKSSVTLRSLDSSDSASSLPAYYVFNIGDKGYIIVSAWDVTIPILGYSDEGPFFTEEDAQQHPGSVSNVLSFLSAYADCIDSLRQHAIVDEYLMKSRDYALRHSVTTETTRAYRYVSPLLGNIKWDQSPYYNDYCPPGTPVGCVATAMCQIMKYWEYPEYGRGSHRSSSDGQYADYEHRINWHNMPAHRLTRPNRDIAQLCYDVAIGLNMSFTPNVSLTWQYYVPGLLVNHYYYKNTAKNIYRKYYEPAEWEDVVYNELYNGRPVQYAGSGNNGGHSFVCDGYRNGYFHINWGWGGVSDGYFLLHALNPGSLGTGGGAGGFNYGQQVVIGIQPAN